MNDAVKNIQLAAADSADVDAVVNSNVYSNIYCNYTNAQR